MCERVQTYRPLLRHVIRTKANKVYIHIWKEAKTTTTMNGTREQTPNINLLLRARIHVTERICAVNSKKALKDGCYINSRLTFFRVYMRTLCVWQAMAGLHEGGEASNWLKNGKQKSNDNAFTTWTKLLQFTCTSTETQSERRLASYRK